MLVNMLGALALDATAAAIKTAVDAVKASLGAVKSPFGGQLVTTAQHRWRSEFNVLNSNWVVTQSGTGTSAAVASGRLNIVSGTTAGASIEVTGNPLTRSVSVPTKVAFGVNMSQKIPNLELFLELVALNPDGSLDETTVAAWKTTAPESGSQSKYEVRNGARPGFQNATVTTQNHVGADGIFEIQVETDEIWFHAKQANTTATRSNSYVGNLISLDPNRTYVPRIRLYNGSTNYTTGAQTPAAPASSTTVGISFVTGSDYTDLMAEITGASGDNAPGRALAVTVQNAPTATLLSGTVRVGAVAQPYFYYNDTTTVLAAAGVYTSASRDAAGALNTQVTASYGQEWRLSAFADVAGKLCLEVSNDNVTFRRIKVVNLTQPDGGMFYGEIIHRPTHRYLRIAYVNGATAQTYFSVNSLQLA